MQEDINKHPYAGSLDEKIERWAKDAVQVGAPKQQLALMSLLNAISEAAGNHGDAESIVNTALYAAFAESESLLDDAIKSVVKTDTVKANDFESSGDRTTDQAAVAFALSVLLTNRETPADLFEKCADYVNEASSADLHRAVYWQPEVLERLIEHVDDPVGGAQ